MKTTKARKRKRAAAVACTDLLGGAIIKTVPGVTMTINWREVPGEVTEIIFNGKKFLPPNAQGQARRDNPKA
jgi:hypothetical protein